MTETPAATIASGTEVRPRPFAPGRFASAVAIALVVNAVVFWVGSAAGASMIVTQPASTQVTVVVVVIATVAPLVLAGVATWFIALRKPRFRAVASWLGLALAVASAPGPLLVAADLSTGLALGAMHLVAGAAWFIATRRSDRR